MRLLSRLSALSALMLLVPTGVKAEYVQTNLVSDGFVPAIITDSNLKNPWGVSFSSTSPFWVSNQGSNTATLYNALNIANGTEKAPLLTVPIIPASFTPPTGPTGQVNTAAATGFNIPAPGGSTVKAAFIFDGLDGTISAWNPSSVGMNSAIVEVNNHSNGAVYTGLALATVNGNSFLYAANAAKNTIEVYNSNFQPTTLSGNFKGDPNPVPGFSVYNVQTIGTNLFVTYAANNGATPLPGGYVDEFDLNGNFIRRIANNDGHINDPWGLVLAPSKFGAFGGDLLVGNLFDSKISAYNISGPTPIFEGQITTNTGVTSPVGLWALEFGNGVTGDPNTLYFTSGVNDQHDGLFAALAVVPEPASAVQAVLAILGGSIVYAYRRRQSRNVAR